jgi:hypothetical protein
VDEFNSGHTASAVLRPRLNHVKGIASMDPKESLQQKRARRSVSDILEAYYAYWLRLFEEDNERFFGKVMRFYEGRQQASPQIAPAE